LTLVDTAAFFGPIAGVTLTEQTKRELVALLRCSLQIAGWYSSE
jgi:hypothetical protein